MNRQVVCVDGQADFGMPPDMIPGMKSGALYVCQDRKSLKTMISDPLGGYQAMLRFAKFIKRMVPVLDDLHMTLDMHQYNHIANNVLYRDKKGNVPPPFTQITEEMAVNREIVPVIASAMIDYGGKTMSFYDYWLYYIRQLKSNNRYGLTLWPVHCLLDGPGSSLIPELSEACQAYASQRHAVVDFVNKGSDYRTEHYSAVKAEVPDPDDMVGTGLNMRLVNTIETADELYWGGIAGDYCVQNTFVDATANFGPDVLQRSVLLLDCIASIDQSAFQKFVKEMVAKGVRTAESKDVF
jgi:nicotinamidase/pyrazinamidase